MKADDFRHRAEQRERRATSEERSPSLFREERQETLRRTAQQDRRYADHLEQQEQRRRK